MKKLLFVMNPNAGTRKANKVLPEIFSIFNRAGYSVTAYMTAGPGDCTQIIARMAREMDVVVCCGGDGTFHEAINGLLRSGVDIPIGYIPAGTTNDFAASLHLPLGVIEAAKAIVEGTPHRYDVGKFGEEYFCYVASFGAFTKASYATPQNVKHALGHGAYILGGIQELSQLRSAHLRLELDGAVIEDNFIFGAISNSTSVGGVLTLDPQYVDMADGMLELLLIRTPRDLAELSECIFALQNPQPNCNAITFRSAKKILVSGEGAMTWTLDGERADCGETIEIRNIHNAIQLLQRG